MTDAVDRPQPRRPVVGGGIAGLAAACRGSRRRCGRTPRSSLLEAADRVGGKLRPGEVAGVWVDVGAEAMLARRPEGVGRCIGRRAGRRA